MKKKIFIFSILLVLGLGMFMIANSVLAADCACRATACADGHTEDSACLACEKSCADAVIDPCLGFCSSDEVCINGSCQNKTTQTTQTTGGSTNNGAAVAIQNPLGNGVTVDDLIKKFILSILGFSGVLALIAFVYGGMFWLVSMGDTNKITKGKNIMIWAVFGLAVIFGSYAIVSAIYSVLGIQ
ncbi:MAG: pilin [Patescibacteria group bacterium]|jgi:hypothetical protein